jgi:chromosome segregation ATPase
LLESKSAQYSQAEATISELRQELSQYSDVEGKMEDYEDNFTVFGKEIERLNMVLKGKTAEMQDLEDRLTESESYLRSKREENEFLISSQLKLSEEINILKA